MGVELVPGPIWRRLKMSAENKLGRGRKRTVQERREGKVFLILHRPGLWRVRVEGSAIEEE
jgi:hypothetical protein